jgi:hypothetical protein
MAIRYFKATNGRFTIFRATASRVYGSAWIQCDAHCVTLSGFSMKPASASVYPIPAIEIDRAEYERLNERKAARLILAGGNPKWAAPSDSWVRNEPDPAIVQQNREAIASKALSRSILARAHREGEK